MDKAALIEKAREYIRLEQAPEFKKQIEDLLAKSDWQELNDRFYTELAFGTGGIRGVIGGGYNRLNTFIIRKTTQGLANYIKKNMPPEKASVAIAFDSRNYSYAFALEAALVLCGNGITTYLFTSLRPTPELSFAVRWLPATAGIVFTASHNPAEYNGYKVYWSDGGQIVPPHDTGIVEEVRRVRGTEISSCSEEEAGAKELLQMIDEKVDGPFIDMVKGLCLRPDLVREKGSSLKVVYTPLHGAGAMPVERSLSEMGIRVIFVEQQKAPDGNFPTVQFPNPEEASAMKMALELGRREKADLVLGTDPDADRLGIAVPNGDDFTLITGNQLGALLLDYILLTRKEAGTLPANGAVIKTIVTSELLHRIAEHFGVRCYDVLTGFKYVGEKICEFEKQKNGPVFLFGGEESYGYLVNTEVRDKDAVSAATMTAEMALYHVSQGRTVLDRLNQLYEQFGYFEEALISEYFKGESGLSIMNACMNGLRASPPRLFAGQKVTSIKDYRDHTTLDMEKGQIVKNILLPSSDVMQMYCEDGSMVTIRPSGTEPKIKVYASCQSPPGVPLSAARRDIHEKIDAIKQAVSVLIEEAAHA